MRSFPFTQQGREGSGHLAVEGRPPALATPTRPVGPVFAEDSAQTGARRPGLRSAPAAVQASGRRWVGGKGCGLVSRLIPGVSRTLPRMLPRKQLRGRLRDHIRGHIPDSTGTPAPSGLRQTEAGASSDRRYPSECDQRLRLPVRRIEP